MLAACVRGRFLCERERTYLALVLGCTVETRGNINTRSSSSTTPLALAVERLCACCIDSIISSAQKIFEASSYPLHRV